MKICVYGAGAVGGHLAARLAAAGADVTAIARGAHGRAIRERGLVLLRGDERLAVSLKCLDDPVPGGAPNAAALPPQDIIVVTVKGPGLPAVAAKLGSMMHGGTRVVFAMNGIPWWFGDGTASPLPPALVETLDPHARLRTALSREQVVGCAVYSSNEVIEPGVIRNNTPHRNRILVGKIDGGSDATLDAFIELVRSTGMECEVTPDFRQALWNKMLLIVSGSPISALTRRTFGEIVADPDLRRLMASMMREAAALGGALGFHCDDDVDARLDFYRGNPLKPSMLQDLEAGRAIEVDNGISAFRAIAANIGFPVPMLDAVGTLITSASVVRP